MAGLHVAENSADFAPTAQQLGGQEILAQRLALATERFADVMTKDVARFSAELRKTALRDVIGSGLPP